MTKAKSIELELTDGTKRNLQDFNYRDYLKGFLEREGFKVSMYYKEENMIVLTETKPSTIDVKGFCEQAIRVFDEGWGSAMQCVVEFCTEGESS